MKTLDSLANQALLLPKDQRLTLAHRILASIEPTATEGVEAAWDDEIRERIKRYDAGLVTGIPGSEVFKGLDQKLKG